MKSRRMTYQVIGASALVFAVALGGVATKASAIPSEPDDAGAKATPLKREVIVLTRFNPTVRHNEIYCNAAQIIEMPLNYLGITIRLWNIDKGLPPESWLDEVRGVVTWFDGDKPVPKSLWPWLAQVRKRQLKILHLQQLEPLLDVPPDAAEWAALNAHLKHMGLKHRSGYAAGLARVSVAFTERGLHTVEGNPSHLVTLQGPTSVGADNRVWLRTQDRKRPEDVRMPVVTGPWGGIALAPWICKIGGDRNDRRLFLNLFTFFQEALALDDVPAPDPSVRLGRRKFFLHVDGDGFESISTARGKPDECCGLVWEQEICDTFQIPQTLSVIVASLTDTMTPPTSTKTMRIAKRLLTRPEVEAASHTVTHPFVWHKPDAQHDARGTTPHGEHHGKANTEYGFDPPKGFDRTYVSEVTESIAFIEKYLLAPGKRCEGLLWSGDCEPPEAAILAADRLGRWNLNGGGFRVDPAYNSLGYVSPWARVRGKAVQVYVGAANENHFPGFFSTNPGAFFHIAKTLTATARDRILKPANIYAHFYSVERKARMDALKRLIRRFAFVEETIVVRASDYAKAVIAARNAALARTSTGWTFKGFDHCRTLRFEHADQHVDIGASEGVIGQRVMRGRLFVSLGASKGRIVLRDSPPSRPYIEQSNHLLRDVRLLPNGAAFTSEATFARLIVVAGLVPGATVSVLIGGIEHGQETVDEDGRVSIHRPKGPVEQIEVRTT